MRSGMRAMLFWGVCVPLRVTLAKLANAPRIRELLRAFAALLAYRWLSGTEVGNEGVFGGPAFWADERPLHGALWGGYAITGKAAFLWIDVAFGAANWLFSS